MFLYKNKQNIVYLIIVCWCFGFWIPPCLSLNAFLTCGSTTSDTKISIKLLILINIWENFCHLKTILCWQLDWISWFWLTYTFSTCMWGWNIKWEREQRYHVESPEMFLQTWPLWLQNPKCLWNAITTVSPKRLYHPCTANNLKWWKASNLRSDRQIRWPYCHSTGMAALLRAYYKECS